MDQVKQFLVAAKKHHFWIGCGVAVLVALLMYFIGASKISKYFADQVSKAKGANGQITPLIAGVDHPNDHWISAIKQLTDKQRIDVLDAWTRLYQQQAGYFVWPKDKELGDDFRTVFSSPPGATDEQKMNDLCERYQKYITITKLPQMAAIVDAEWTAGASDTAGPRNGRQLAGPGHREPQQTSDSDHVYKVIWNDVDQKQQYTNYDWKSTPTELDVRFAQEEMWVMEAVFNCLAAANDQATGPFDAVVRQIDRVQIGYDAVGRHPLGEGDNRVVYHHSKDSLSSSPLAAPPGAGASGSGAASAAVLDAKRPDRRQLYGEASNDSSAPVRRIAMAPGAGPNNPYPGGLNTGAPTQNGPNDLDSNLKDGRYVDANGKPIGFQELATAQGQEYKLMAFKVVLQVDPTRFDHVVAEFGKSQVPLEIREVRINVESSDQVGGRADVGGRGHRKQPGGEGATAGGDLALELCGVAYIINPPDPAKMGMATNAAPAATGAVPPATGAAPANGAVSNPTAAGVGPAPTTLPSATTPTTPDAGPAEAPPTTPPAGPGPAPSGPAATPATVTPTPTVPNTAAPAERPVTPPNGAPADATPAAPPAK